MCRSDTPRATSIIHFVPAFYGLRSRPFYLTCCWQPPGLPSIPTASSLEDAPSTRIRVADTIPATSPEVQNFLPALDVRPEPITFSCIVEPLGGCGFTTTKGEGQSVCHGRHFGGRTRVFPQLPERSP